jgi:predicted O-methyltransferase YrrM
MAASHSSERTEEALGRLAPDLHEAARGLLLEMYEAASLPGADLTERVEIDPDVRISIEQGAQLFRLVRDRGVVTAFEVGFAYGFSTIWILAGLSGRAGSSHTAIDPFERSTWKGVGLAQAARLTADAAFEHVEDYAIHALSRMIKQGDKAQFAFIDGYHRFDDTLVEFYLADQVIEPGGVIAFDDLWMPSVRAVVDFVETNRAYQRLANPAGNMAVLEKLADDDRPWLHYAPFDTGAAAPPPATLAGRLRRLWSGAKRLAQD